MVLSFSLLMSCEGDFPYQQRIASIGGGSGQFHLLRGLVKLNNPYLITAMPGSWDSGGSSGRLRTEWGILPMGDARQCLVALMEDDDQVIETLRLCEDRFKDVAGPLQGHDFLNLEIMRLTQIHQGFEGGINAFRKRYRIRGNVIPTSPISFDVIAKLQDLTELYGEAELDKRAKSKSFDPENRIIRIYPSTRTESNPLAQKAIHEADKIVFPAGSLWGSILPHLLIQGLPEKIINCKARLIFIINLMTESGQTDGYRASDHLQQFLYLLGDNNRLDYVIVNSNGVDKETLKIYKEERQLPVMIDEPNIRQLAPKAKIIEAQLTGKGYSIREHLTRHDSEAIAKVVLGLS